MTAERWRVGRSVGRTIYVQVGDDPSKGDQLIGVADTRELARRAVDAVNGVLGAAGAGWWRACRANPRLVHTTTTDLGPLVLMDTPELGRQVVDAVNARGGVG